MKQTHLFNHISVVINLTIIIGSPLFVMSVFSNIQIAKSKSLYIFSSGHTIHIWKKQNVHADRTASVRLNLIAGAVAGLTTS